MNFAKRKVVEALRKSYTPGTRVRLVHMDDPYEHIPTGSLGTVQNVDDTGTIHVHWDCGSSLGVVYGEDECEAVK